MEKPKFLYHGSPKKDINSLIPKNKIFEGEEKEFVFASPDKKTALSYLAKGAYGWSAGIYNGEYFVALPVSKEKFKEQDQGGAIYVFDSQNFRSTEHRNDYEWVSEQEEKPVEKELFNSTLETIENADIKMYFLDSEENYHKYLSIKQADQRAAYDFLKSFVK